MQNDENTNDVKVETKDDETVETVEDSEAEETKDESQGDESEATEEETIEQKLAKALAEAGKYKRLFQKTQKAKSETKVETKQTVKPQSSSSPNVEEVVLKAQGMPDELLKQLKKIAQVNGTSLLDAQKDDLFVAFKSKFEKEEKEKKASIGASRGSGKTQAKVTVNTPNLSREDHERLVKEQLGL